MKRTVIAILLLSAVPAAADDFTPALQGFLGSDIAGWANDPALVAAIRAQNATTGSYDQATIDAMDAQWRSEVSAADSALVGGVLHNPAADFLRTKVADSGGKITEAFITDAKGLNVAASDPTSDYWQGDEDKFSKVYPDPKGVFISDVEMDESTQRYQGQISVTVADPATGEALGTLTIGVDAESLI
ncbi:cache domain-containing protein [Rhodobacter ferrooxidans]|nr:cache domain-containing protein [Rhodobacter sp. SW2]